MAPSYLAQQRRNREQAEDNFKKRYNPADDVMAQLDDIDDQMYAREKDAKSEKRQGEQDLAEKTKYASEVAMKSNAISQDEQRYADEQRIAADERKRKSTADARPRVVAAAALKRKGDPASDIQEEAVAAGMGLKEMEAELERIDREAAIDKAKRDDDSALNKSKIAANERRGQPKVLTPEQRDRLDKKDRKTDLEIATLEKGLEGKGLDVGAKKTKPADDLRKEMNADKIVKDYKESEVNIAKIRQAAKSSSAPGDIALIFSFMKLLDPGSTVREGEYASARNAAGIPDQIRNYFNKALDGEQLNPEQRSAFVKEAEGYHSAHKKAYDDVAKRYGGIAKRRGASEEDVTGQSSPEAEADSIFSIGSDDDGEP